MDQPRAAVMIINELRNTLAAITGDPTMLELSGSARLIAGGGNGPKESHVAFPSKAITRVLILAESHLSIHTWPEENLVAIDLFSCGTINGRGVIEHLTRSLHLDGGNIREIPRG